MTTTDTRRPLWQRTWVRVTGSIAALALVAGAGAAGTALASPHTVTNRPAANSAPAHPQPTKTPAKAPVHQAPAPRSAGAVPAGYVQHILAAGITAPAAWIGQTGQQLAGYWQRGYTAAWTDANVLTPGGIYAYHLAAFDQITARDFGVTPPAQGIQPAPAAPAAPAPVQQAPAPAPAGPQLTNGVAVVLQFYQDLTNRDYQAAWALGGSNLNGGAGYSAWVAGYATTASIDVTGYGTWSDGTVWTHLSAAQTNGTVKTYDGTYTVAGGVIVSAHMTQTS